MVLYHLTNIGPGATWKINRIKEKFPNLPIIYRDYPITMAEAEGNSFYDEGAALMNGFHSIGFSRELTDQQVFEVFQYMFGLRK